MKLQKLFLILCIALCSVHGQSQSLNISLEEGSYQVDDQHMMILARIDSIENYSILTQYHEVNITLGADEYSFNPKPNYLKYSESYKVKKGSDNYTIYFTQLPIISITSNSTIVDEPKVLAEFMYSDDDVTFSSYIGIEIRGGYSKSFPKKTFDIEFWLDSNGLKKRPVKFGNLRLDDDWILDALYNEPLRIRSYLAHNLWLKIHQLYYQAVKTEAKSGAEVIYAEVFLNGSYNGVYIISEQVDKKQLQIEEHDGTIRGELYKAVSWGKACTYDELPSYTNNSRNWGGFDYEYPEDWQATNWFELYDFIDFVINASDNNFKADIWNRFNKENCMDYYIYLNLIRAGDNRGKNIFVGKLDVGEPYFNTPWDLDACFGTNWEGNNDPRTENILTNGLFRRAIRLNAGDFKTDMGNKWHAYRENILSNETMDNYFSEAYNYLLDNNIYERESIVYPNYDFSVASYDYMIDWLHERLIFLDSYFIKTADPTPTAINLESHIHDVRIYPNPANDHIQIKLENEILDQAFSILSLTGKIVLQGTLEMNEQIDVSSLSSGLYFIKLAQSTHKLIIR